MLSGRRDRPLIVVEPGESFFGDLMPIHKKRGHIVVAWNWDHTLGALAGRVEAPAFFAPDHDSGFEIEISGIAGVDYGFVFRFLELPSHVGGRQLGGFDRRRPEEFPLSFEPLELGKCDLSGPAKLSEMD